MKETGKYSFGIGDRFSHQGKAQLEVLMKTATELGIHITPVWNKSNREHNIVHSEPADTHAEADAAVKAMNYSGPYFVNADHINLSTVGRFIDHSDFFTLEVADYIGKRASDTDIEGFVEAHLQFCGHLEIPGIAGLDIAKLIYRRTFERREELCGPYATVIDIKPELLPAAEVVDSWDNLKFAETLRHVPGNPNYNPSFRQLIHVGYKVASELGVVYTDALKTNAGVIAGCVKENLYDRHISLLFRQ